MARTDVAGRFPVNTSLQIMVADDQLLDHAHDEIVLFFGHAYETFAVHAAAEDCFPASHLLENR
jgi:hypothetical protein